MSARVADWEARLAEAVAAALAQPFAWGTHDCLTWAAGVRRALTGEDAARDWRGTYATARGAARVLRRRGHGTIAAAISAELGPPLPTVLFAQRGDVVVLRHGRRFAAAGICLGAEAVFPGETGLVRVPLDRCALAWRV